MNYTHNVTVRLDRKGHLYDVIIADEVLEDAGSWARACLPEGARKITLVSNEKIFSLYGESVVSSLKSNGYDTFIWLMEDGEKFKNFVSLKRLLLFLADSRMGRTDAVLALGGGVVGDLAGFAAAVYLRGIPYLQIPTTLLAMIDSSIGGKTAVNFESGKNVIGSFHQPAGVLIDISTLQTLERRELSAGFYEAVKQGAVAGEELFGMTFAFLKEHSPQSIAAEFPGGEFISKLKALLHAQINFKLDVVTGDEMESPDRNDPRSRKILNFGHTVGHALEKITNYDHFKHGEAIGYGILAAGEISKKLEILDINSLNLLNGAIASIGALPNASRIEVADVLEALSFDKKAINESVQWILLEGIGRPLIVRQTEIPQQIIGDALTRVLRR